MDGRRSAWGAKIAASLAVGTLMSGATFTVAGASTSSSSASPGITATTVTVGQIDDLSAPIPGLFKAAEDGTKAAFAYINSKGGVNGRMLELDAKDSAYTSSTVVSDAEAQAKADFAFVGGYSLLDGAEKGVIDEYNVPDITYPLASTLSNDSHVYSPSPSTTNDTPTGPYEWAKKQFPNESKHIGILYAAADPTTIDSEFTLDNAMKHAGLAYVYRQGFPETQFTFTPQVLAMKSDGVSMFYDQELPGLYAGTVAKEAKQQGLNVTDVQGIAAYVDNMQSLSGGTADGMYLVQQASLFEGQDANAIPAVKTFDTWAKKIDPQVFNSTTPFTALDGWASGMLFAQALKAAGPNPTRASLTAQLNKVTSFSAGGRLPPGENPAQNIPSKCFIVAQFKNGTWARVSPTPKSGYICSGSLYARDGWTPENR
jgi:ABC-type branched-subunit amino acid transport system substrate-binding protein